MTTFCSLVIVDIGHMDRTPMTGAGSSGAGKSAHNCGPCPLTEVIIMDVQAITTIIGTLGFPIAACIALFWKLEQEQELHKTEVDRLTEAINEMRNVMTELSTYIKTMSGR